MSNLDCTICHESNLEEVGELDTCDHCFCVRCILEWSKISNTCPLCKQRFWVVYHKRLDMSKLGNTSENVADKFPGEVLVTHKVAERNQAPVNENGDEFEDPVDSILCMECGGAQDEDLTLLCEGCNQGCHSYCADPPIEDISAIGDWYCTACAPTLAPTIQRGRRSQSTRPSTSQASNVTRRQDAESRAFRRRTRNQRRAQALARSSDAEVSCSDSDFSFEEKELNQEREDFISSAAAAIAGGVGRSRRSGNRPRQPVRRQARGQTRGRVRVKSSSPVPQVGNDDSDLEELQVRRQMDSRPSRASMHNTALRNRARLQSMNDTSSALPTLAHRNVEGLRRNWEAIRREEREFGQHSDHEQESSDEDPRDRISLADRASILRATRILAEQKSRQRKPEGRPLAEAWPRQRSSEVKAPLLSFSAQCRAELTQSSAKSRAIGPRRTSAPQRTALSPASLQIAKRKAQRDVGPGPSKRLKEAPRPSTSRSSGRDVSDFRERDLHSQFRDFQRQQISDRAISSPINKPARSNSPNPTGPASSRQQIPDAKKEQAPVKRAVNQHGLGPARNMNSTKGQLAYPSGEPWGRVLPSHLELRKATATSPLQETQERRETNHDDNLRRNLSGQIQQLSSQASHHQSQPSHSGQMISSQLQRSSVEQNPPPPAPAPARDTAVEQLEREAHNLPAGSEDSAMSCPGMFSADRTLASSEVQQVSEAAEAVSGREKDNAEMEERKEEARLAALKTRKDAAAKDVKQYTDRWYQEKKISATEFKALAKLATHDLYKGTFVAGSEGWHEQKKHIVRNVLKDLRAARQTR